MRHSAVVFSVAVAFCAAPGVFQVPAWAETSAWTMPKGNLQRTGASDATFILPLNLIWRHSTDAKVTGRGLFSPLVVGPPGDRRVFFVGGRNLFCVNAQNGTQVWKSEDLASALGAPLSLLSGDAGDAILAVTSSGRLTAFRTSDGGVLWEAETRGGIQGGAPTIIKTPKGERILIVTATGKVLAFQKDGTPDPDYNIRIGAGATAITSSPALSADGTLLFLTVQDQKLYAIDVAKATPAYTVPLGKTAFETPIVLGDRVVVAVGSMVRCFQAKSGNPLWTFNSGTRGRISASPSGSSGAQGRVYAGTERGDFYALDLGTGQKLWTAELGTGTNVGASTVLPDLVLVGTKSDVLFGLKPSDGRVVWQYRPQSQRVVPATDAAAVIVDQGGAAGEGGPVLPPPPQPGGPGAPGAGIGVGENLAPPTGTVRTYGVSAAPVAVDRQLFLLADNASLYAFESTPFDAVPPYPAEPSLALNDADKKFTSFLLDPDEPMVVPGTAPLVFAVQLSDPGSGVVPESIKVLVNAQAVSGPTRVDFQPGSGILSVNLIEVKPGQRPQLPDGVYTVAVGAKDYAGNELSYTGTFTVERAAPPPKKKVPDVVINGGAPGGGSGSGSGSGSSSSSGSGRPGGIIN